MMKLIFRFTEKALDEENIWPDNENIWPEIKKNVKNIQWFADVIFI